MSAAKPYWDAFIALFIVFDSVGNIPIFYSLTRNIREEERDKIFLKSVAVASALLIFFMLFGYSFLQYYGVTISDFKIAGGLLLLLIAVEGLLGHVEAEQIQVEDIAIVPMATPLLAGPGSIYMVMYLNTIYGPLPTLTSIAANTLLAYILLKYSKHILRHAGRNSILVISKVFSLLLAVIAVSMMRGGVEEIVEALRLHG